MASITSGASTDILTIDPVSKAARVTQYDSDGNLINLTAKSQPTTISGVGFLGVNDRQVLPARMDRLGSLASATHMPLLADTFEGTVTNPIRWLITATTMAATQTTIGGLVINSGAITTINTGYMIQSANRFFKTQRTPLQVKLRSRINPQNNSVQEMGFGVAPSFNGPNTTGAYWQVTNSGVVQPVITYNSVDITGTDVRSLLNTNNYYTWDIFVDDGSATFTVQDTSTGLIISTQTINLPATAQRLFSATALPVQLRVYNSGVAPVAASQMIVTDVYALELDSNKVKSTSDLCASLQRGMTANPFTGAQLSQWTNSAEPANAALSNTVASYTTLGGKFQLAAVAGAVTDYCLFGFQVPVGQNFYMTGISIDVWNTVVASATTPTLLTWAVGVGSTAVSLATATVTRMGLGSQTMPVGTAPGTSIPALVKSFRTPLHCPSGRFIQIILRMPVGTATATQVIAGMANVEGYFD
jgi:hypothetical protein